MDIKQYLHDQKLSIDAYLREYMDSLNGIPAVLKESMAYSLFAGGKRVRPILSLAVCEVLEGNRETALAGGSALELIHTYSLIHDDLPCMDDDDLRRGMPTSHRKFGEASAVLAGDGLQALAFDLVCTRVTDPEICAAIVRETARAAGPSGMVGGQVLDLEFENTPCSLEQLQEIHAKKTGAMIRASVMIGVLSGECSDEMEKSLSGYGADLGLLFQIADDILDVEGNTESLGKTVGKDAQAGKSTYPAIKGLEGARAFRDEVYEKCLKDLEILSGRDTILRELTRFIAYRDH